MNTLLKITFKMGAVLASLLIVLLVVVVGVEFFKKRVVISSAKLPSVIAQAGFSEDLLALRLLEKINSAKSLAVAPPAGNDLVGPRSREEVDFTLPLRELEIHVPQAGLSTGEIVATIRRVFGIEVDAIQVYLTCLDLSCEPKSGYAFRAIVRRGSSVNMVEDVAFSVFETCPQTGNEKVSPRSFENEGLQEGRVTVESLREGIDCALSELAKGILRELDTHTYLVANFEDIKRRPVDFDRDRRHKDFEDFRNKVMRLSAKGREDAGYFAFLKGRILLEIASMHGRGTPQAAISAEDAFVMLRRSIALARDKNDRELEAAVLTQVGAAVRDRQVSVQQASEYCPHGRQGGDCAKEIFRKAIRLNPNEASAHSSLGLAIREGCLWATHQQTLEVAVQHYRTAIRLNPGYVRAYNNKAVALRYLGRPHEAEESYRRAINVDPSFTLAIHNLAILLMFESRYSEALHYILAAKEKGRRTPRFFARIAQIFFLNGRDDDLEAILDGLRREEGYWYIDEVDKIKIPPAEMYIFDSVRRLQYGTLDYSEDWYAAEWYTEELGKPIWRGERCPLTREE